MPLIDVFMRDNCISFGVAQETIAKLPVSLVKLLIVGVDRRKG